MVVVVVPAAPYSGSVGSAIVKLGTLNPKVQLSTPYASTTEKGCWSPMRSLGARNRGSSGKVQKRVDSLTP